MSQTIVSQTVFGSEQPISPAATVDWAMTSRNIAEHARAAATALAAASGQQRTDALLAIAQRLRDDQAAVLAANQQDLAAAQDLSKSMIDRLTLTEARLHKLAGSVEEVAKQVDPVGQVLDGRVLPNGARLEKWQVPLGVICIIFESRPNVLVDAAALCIRSGNASILRGGKECLRTNIAMGACVAAGLEDAGLPEEAVCVVDKPDHSLVPALLQHADLIDLVVPRGGERLIRAVVQSSKVPVIKHYTGNCHVYVHGSMNDDERFEKLVRQVTINAKCQRPGVCNAAETILFDFFSAPKLLTKVCGDLLNHGVQIRGCERTCELFPDAALATDEDWRAEYLDLVVAVKIVSDFDEAVAHINYYGSKHTDAILTTDINAGDAFCRLVDSATVMVNASTRLADGGEFGLGAEIGISTDKLHARGPMGASDLCTYKWVLTGNGQVRM